MIRSSYIPAIRRRILIRKPAPWICDSCCRSYATRRAKNPEPQKPARTRFAPSPTGYLHLGSLRTALFNYLLAKRTGGQFLLRIEDTDQKRTVEGAEAALFDILKWAGLQWDEGPEVGGDYGPYRQSERSHIHKEHAWQLLETGHAYRCFCTVDRLRSLAQKRAHLGLTSEYDRTCESIPASESASRAASGEPHVIRLKVPDKYPEFTDSVYGRIRPGQMTVRHGEPAFEDPILIKTDGLPTYHLANVVDDHLMEITHVIRGIEWMPSTAKHVYMYAAFGWTPPVFCHVGLLQDKSGQKLSKRTGDVHVSEYRKNGYLPEALLNFVALLGWNNRLKSDLLPLEALAKNFAINDLTKGNTKVNFSKLDFLQKAYVQQYMSAKSSADTSYVSSMISSIQESIAHKFPDTPEDLKSSSYIAEILECDLKNFITAPKFVEKHDYFFLPEPNFESEEASAYRSKLSGDEVIKAREALTIIAKSVKQRRSKGEEWNNALIDDIIAENWEDKESQRIVQRCLRYALAGGRSGPGIHEIMMLLGEQESLKRMMEVRWAGKRGLVDEKGRVVMTWQEPKEAEEDEEGGEDEEAEIERLIEKSREA